MNGDENYNVVGEYKSYTIHGIPVVYKKDDLVTYKGKTYVATKTIKEPITPDSGEDFGWKPIDDNRAIKFSTGTEPPHDPQPGDEWFDTTNGILMKYIDDDDSEQWIEV
jgi:hypothetical protein